MPLIDDARRWIKDKVADDELAREYERLGIKPSDRLAPKAAIRYLDQHLEGMSISERIRNFAHQKGFADMYHQGRHNEHVPLEVKSALMSVERRIERLNTVDKAREIVAKYGGPPTKETVIEALHRSIKERSNEMENCAAPAPQKQISKEPSKQRTMEMEV